MQDGNFTKGLEKAGAHFEYHFFKPCKGSSFRKENNSEKRNKVGQPNKIRTEAFQA